MKDGEHELSELLERKLGYKYRDLFNVISSILLISMGIIYFVIIT